MRRMTPVLDGPGHALVPTPSSRKPWPGTRSFRRSGLNLGGGRPLPRRDGVVRGPGGFSVFEKAQVVPHTQESQFGELQRVGECPSRGPDFDRPRSRYDINHPGPATGPVAIRPVPPFPRLVHQGAQDQGLVSSWVGSFRFLRPDPLRACPTPNPRRTPAAPGPAPFRLVRWESTGTPPPSPLPPHPSRLWVGEGASPYACHSPREVVEGGPLRG